MEGTPDSTALENPENEITGARVAFFGAVIKCSWHG
jgi:hypothetical protein